MHSFQDVTPDYMECNPFEKIGKEWMLVTAEKNGVVNTMTASWGGVGILWGKEVATLYIRPQRYTKEFIDAGASHVIVTSYVFKDGMIHFQRLQELVQAVGKKHLVLDLSCKRKKEGYVIVTDRWQKESKEVLNVDLLETLSQYCDEFLIHAVDVEGKNSGIELELVKLLGGWGKRPVTYAGGVHSFEDLELLKIFGNNKIHVTIGSSLDLFGGEMNFERVLEYIKNE